MSWDLLYCFFSQDFIQSGPQSIFENGFDFANIQYSIRICKKHRDDNTVILDGLEKRKNGVESSRDTASPIKT